MRFAIRFLLLLACVLGIGGVFAKPALTALGRWLTFEKTGFEKVDAIVVLEGGLPDRARQAGDLFREKKADRIVLVRERRRHDLKELDEIGIYVPGDCELNREVLRKVGVPEASIFEAPGDVVSTQEEAIAFAKYASRNAIRSAVLVTCRFHTRRAFLNFNGACQPKGIAIYVVPSKYCDDNPAGWWKRRDQLKLVYVEVAKLVAYYLGFR